MCLKIKIDQFRVLCPKSLFVICKKKKKLFGLEKKLTNTFKWMVRVQVFLLREHQLMWELLFLNDYLTAFISCVYFVNVLF